MHKNDNNKFASKLGIILATAGSAVGLGNIWRFPYMAGHDGGAAFILIYLGCVLLLGIPGMVGEFIVGRHSFSNAARAYRSLSHGTPWMIIGYMGVFTSMIILGYYSVVAGWCLQYFFAAISGDIHGSSTDIAKYFSDFSNGALMPMIWTVLFILMTHFVVVRGVRNGIEKASKLMMPTLFVILIIIVVSSCLLPNAGKGLTFLFKPDFHKITGNVFLDALGQAFFSLSLGTACLCTYASYFGRNTHLMKSATQIALIDTLVAIMAGMMIFPAAFSVGVNPDSGPSLVFVTLPIVFQQAFAAVPILGYIISILFYALLILAALTSTISMHEIGTAFFYEELHLSRKGGAWIVTVVCCLIGIFSSLSVNPQHGFSLFGSSLMNCFDFLSAQILLPLGSLLTCLFVGWYIPKKIVRDEFTNWGTLRGKLFHLYLFTIRIICPILIASILLHQFGIIR